MKQPGESTHIRASTLMKASLRSSRSSVTRGEKNARATLIILVVFSSITSLSLPLTLESSALTMQVGVDAPSKKKPPSDKSIKKSIEPSASRSRGLFQTKVGKSNTDITNLINWVHIAQDVPPNMANSAFRSKPRQIPAGEFLMGSNKGDPDESPVHLVRISRSFEMGKYEVTQAQWEAVMVSNPSAFIGASRPVENVSWKDVQEFIKKLNERNDGYIYRLPTEAEWEYAGRAGSVGTYAGKLDAMAWYGKNSGERTNPVAQKQPNAWGLYDMHGNVSEWCQDWYDEKYYAQSPRVDPQGPKTGSMKVLRGGDWSEGAQDCRLANRYGQRPDSPGDGNFGFRLVRTRH